MPRSVAIVILTALPFLAPRPGVAADGAAGQTIFNRCKICHSLEAGKNMVGPSLHGLFGRKAGSVDNYTYSGAMKDSRVVWDDDTLAKYLRDPKAFIPGDKMAFPGIKDDNQIADLLAYLHQAAQ
jgi:cytochrome c2